MGASAKIQLQAFSLEQTDSLLAFVERNPWSIHWPRDLLQRFFSDMISSPSLVLDIFSQNQRAAAAILLDRITNLERLACLELLGLAALERRDLVLATIIDSAKILTPHSLRGFQVSLPSPIDPDCLSIISGADFQSLYDLYEMENSHPSKAANLAAGKFVSAGVESEREIYDLLKICFAENLDFNIQPFADWQRGRANSPKLFTYVCRVDGRIVASLNLNLPEQGSIAEIRTIGVHPDFRRQGLGEALIRHALAIVVAASPEYTCALSVAIKNQNALRLYQKLGFAEQRCFHVFAWYRVV